MKSANDQKQSKKREIRERLEGQVNKTRNKGFMTPDRKKALKVRIDLIFNPFSSIIFKKNISIFSNC